MGIDYCYAPGLMSACKLACLVAGGRVTYIGTPISTACCSAASNATRAPLCVKVGSEAVAAAVGAILRCMCSNNLQERLRGE
jgi:hypothetical protein